VPQSDRGEAGSAPPVAEPFVSLVLTGRNDGYGGDFVARFLRTLRFNDRQLVDHGVPHEIVFVEWSPPRGVPRLIDLAFEALPQLAAGVCTWYIVDPKYQQTLSLNPRLEYLEFVAKNVGVRRARGRFVLTSNCDVFLGRTVLDVLRRGALEPRVIYRAVRFDLKQTTDHSTLDWDVLEDPRNLDVPPKRLKPPLLTGGTGDFILLDRASFHELRGFNEVYRAARIGIDRNFLVKAMSAGLAFRDIGGPVYHLNHPGSYRLTAATYVGREAEAHWGDRRWHSGGVIYMNPPTWGLAQAPATQLASHSWYLDFSWDAVPPLVDLKRVVLPVTRVGGPTPGRYVSRS
jgi:hypothetical protein